MTRKKEKLAIVIPAYNEEETIGETLEDVNKNFKKADVFVVNDGSKDKTKEIALEKGAVVLTHIQNRGLGASLATGLLAAVKHGADYIVTFDADLQHTGKDVEKLLKPIKKGEADATIGSRFLRTEDLEMMPFLQVFGNKVLTTATNILSGTKVTDSQSGLRAFSREAAEEILILCDKYEVSSEIVHELAKHDMKVKEIPIKARYDERSLRKGTNVREGIKILIGIILKKLGLKK
ncbi:MAG: glycosyltransferase family 2 protein [Candidatus Undinarchaeales archaeon]